MLDGNWTELSCENVSVSFRFYEKRVDTCNMLLDNNIKSLVLEQTDNITTFSVSIPGVCSIYHILPQFMHTLIDVLIALQWKRSYLLDTKQPKFGHTPSINFVLIYQDLWHGWMMIQDYLESWPLQSQVRFPLREACSKWASNSMLCYCSEAKRRLLFSKQAQLVAFSHLSRVAFSEEYSCHFFLRSTLSRQVASSEEYFFVAFSHLSRVASSEEYSCQCFLRSTYTLALVHIATNVICARSKVTFTLILKIDA